MRQAVVFVLCALAAAPASLLAQGAAPVGTVAVAGRPLFVIRSGVGTFSTAERATAINERLARVAARPRAADIVVRASDVGLFIAADETPVMSVTDADALAEKTSTRALAERWREAIAGALGAARAQDARRTLARRVATTAAVILLALVLLWGLARGRRALGRRVARIPIRDHGIRFRGLELVPASATMQGIERAISTAFVALGLVTLAGALLLVFSQFPATQGYANTVLGWVWQPLVEIFWGTVAYLPHLITILVIVVVSRALMRVVGFVFDQADRGTISLEPWIPRDVARPTSVLVRTAVGLIALFFIAPLIPGTGSTAARGLSVIIGLAVSFGSSSTVGNLIAGIVLAYMRPFKLGDRVRVAETTGDVVERTFLHTKILTIRNEEVVIPSLMVIGGAMTNYSARARQDGLILHTAVTIGYDAPWRKVHELLIAAARATPDIAGTPSPFVRQTALNDWFVSYELNAYTSEANRMATILSDLHQHIQDEFNAAGVEIMSPHYLQLRDGNAPAMPEEYVTPGDRARRFVVDASGAAGGRRDPAD